MKLISQTIEAVAAIGRVTGEPGLLEELQATADAVQRLVPDCVGLSVAWIEHGLGTQPGGSQDVHDELAWLLGSKAPWATRNADLSFDSRRTAESAPEVLRTRGAVALAVGFLAARAHVDVDVAQQRLEQAAARAGISGEAQLKPCSSCARASRELEPPEGGRRGARLSDLPACRGVQLRGVPSRRRPHPQMQCDRPDLGGINFYSTSSDDVSPEAEALARLFASHAAIALGHARDRENLNEALQTRKVIGEAIGILMERHLMNEDRAFAFLVRASSHSNIKLRVLAPHLVDERNTP